MKKMSYVDKIAILTKQLIEIHELFKQVDFKSLSKEDYEEFKKIATYLDYYSINLLSLGSDKNQEEVKNNQALVKDLIKDIEFFIKNVKENMNFH